MQTQPSRNVPNDRKIKKRYGVPVLQLLKWDYHFRKPKRKRFFSIVWKFFADQDCTDEHAKSDNIVFRALRKQHQPGVLLAAPKVMRLTAGFAPK